MWDKNYTENKNYGYKCIFHKMLIIVKRCTLTVLQTKFVDLN